MSINTSRRETVFQALNFTQSSGCPYYIWIDNEMVPPLTEYFGRDQILITERSPNLFAGSYTAMTEISARPVKELGECFIDDFGVMYKRGAALHVERPALPEPTLEGYQFPDLTTDSHFAHLESWINFNVDRFRIVQLGMLFFERTWGMRRMEDFFMDLYINTRFVEDLLNGLEATCHAVIERLISEYGDRIDAIGLSEDYGSQKNLLISPESWRFFIKPRLKRIINHIRQAGKYAYIHSCGHVTPVIPDLIEIGVNMLQPIQPEAMDVFDLKRRFGRHMCLVGGISTQELLPYSTPDKIWLEVKRYRKEMGRNGGFVMAPAKPILPDVPVENAIALIEAFQDKHL